MDRRAVLAAFDEQIRRRPDPDGPGGRIEHDDRVICSIGGADGWTGVVWSGLDEAGADAAIAAQVGRFAQLSRPWEWKHYSYDRPADLDARLIAAGFTRAPAETLLVAEIGDLALDVPPPVGVELRAVAGGQDVEALVAVLDEVFGEDHSGLGRTLIADLDARSAAGAAIVGWAGESAIGAGRVEFHAGTEFASLWGDATLPAWRGRGVFRSLVAHRAALASEAGYRYLQVDASSESRPIFRRLGFAELATTTPFMYPGGR